MTPRDDGAQAASTPGAVARARAWPAVVAVTTAAFVLRLLTVTHGLPEFREEAWPFREAFAMWGWATGSTDLNPHRFHYPSLTFYLHFLVQKCHLAIALATGQWQNAADYWVAFRTDPSPMVVPARMLGIAFDLATVGLVVWIGERLQRHAGVLAGLVLAFSATLIAATGAIVTDTYMTALAVAALATMVAYAQGGARSMLVATSLLIGLATGAKYPAAVMLLPLAAVLATRHHMRAIPMWIACAAGAFVVFLLTTPYALLDFQTFWRDLAFVRQLPQSGHLGRLEGTGLAFHAMNLLGEVGPLCLALVAVGLVRTLRRPLERPGALALWLALVGFALPIFFARVEAARYLVAVLPFLVLAATITGFDMTARLARQRGIATALVWVGFLLPPIVTGIPVVLRSGDSTQVLARKWFEENVGQDVLIVQEAYGAPLLSRLESFETRSSALFQRASEPVRRQYEERQWFHSAHLPFATVGPGTVVLPGLDGRDVTIQLVPHSVDFNPFAYDPRLFADADYVVTSSAVRRRFEQDPRRFAAILETYRLLDSTAVKVAEIASAADVPGPDITVYRLGDTAHARFAAFGPLDPLWWVAVIPQPARAQIEQQVVPADRRTAGDARNAQGRAAGWVVSLNQLYRTLIRPFAYPMSLGLVELDRNEPSLHFAEATLQVIPDDLEACLIYTTAAAALERWDDGLAVIDRTASALGDAPPVLRVERVQLLLGAERLAEARRELEALRATLAADDPLRGQIEGLLEMVGELP